MLLLLLRFVRREGLSLHDSAVGRYSVDELIQSLRWLCSRFNELRYDDGLRRYILQLECVAARRLLYADGAGVHDAAAYRTEAGGGTYIASEALLATCCAASAALHARLRTTDYLQRAKPSDLGLPDVREGDADALRAWFRKLASRTLTRNPSDWLRERYVEASLWPAEREFYRLENPHDATATTLTILRRHRTEATGGNADAQADGAADRSIIKSRRGVQYAAIIADSARSSAEVIEERMSEAPESPLLQLALVETTALYAFKHWNEADWFDYCVMSRDLEAHVEAFHFEPEVPRVAQIFHHFQFVWKNRVVWVDSYIESLALWFAAVSLERAVADGQTLAPFHLSLRTSIEDAAREIFASSALGRRCFSGQRIEATIAQDPLPHPSFQF